MHLSKTFTSIVGRRLPTGTRPAVAPDLDLADRDLAILLLTRPAGTRSGQTRTTRSPPSPQPDPAYQDPMRDDLQIDAHPVGSISGWSRRT
jgi:hypothetical protein